MEMDIVTFLYYYVNINGVKWFPWRNIDLIKLLLNKRGLLKLLTLFRDIIAI